MTLEMSPTMRQPFSARAIFVMCFQCEKASSIPSPSVSQRTGSRSASHRVSPNPGLPPGLPSLSSSTLPIPASLPGFPGPAGQRGSPPIDPSSGQFVKGTTLCGAKLNVKSGTPSPSKSWSIPYRTGLRIERSRGSFESPPHGTGTDGLMGRGNSACAISSARDAAIAPALSSRNDARCWLAAVMRPACVRVMNEVAMIISNTSRPTTRTIVLPRRAPRHRLLLKDLLLSRVILVYLERCEESFSCAPEDRSRTEPLGRLPIDSRRHAVSWLCESRPATACRRHSMWRQSVPPRRSR